MSQSHSTHSQRWEQRLDKSRPVRIDGELNINSPKKPGCGQTAAGVAADCTAVCCCCPFAIINMFIFCLVKIPVRVTVRSVRWVKRKAHKCRHDSCSCKKTRGAGLLYDCDDDKDLGCLEEEKGDDKDVVFVFGSSVRTKEEMELENEMLKNLSGFGRSLSQRHEYSTLC